jgi:hypothetical protein
MMNKEGKIYKPSWNDEEEKKRKDQHTYERKEKYLSIENDRKGKYLYRRRTEKKTTQNERQ